MPQRCAVLFAGVLLVLSLNWGLAQGSRYIIDDDQYLEKTVAEATRLLAQGKLVSVQALRSQVHPKHARLQFLPPAQQKIGVPELYDRLRESTLSVGTLYKCPDCVEWHFGASAGFVVAEGGIVCTCCHVITAEDKGVKEGYLVAVDDQARVFPVRSVVAADVEADVCFLRIEGPALKPLPLRTGVRTGERVFCLSHPGGYHFMYTSGMVARLNRQRSEIGDGQGRPTGVLGRPVLFLNITAEFAPGSSGAPIVDESGNVVGQVASIADAGEPGETGEDRIRSPSVPVRFCTATEEIVRLTETVPAHTQSRAGKGAQREKTRSQTRK